MIGMTAVLVLAVGAVAAQAQPQLAGTWMLDPAQSQFPTHGDKGPGGTNAQAPQPKIKLVVEQQGNAVKVTRTMVMGTRERSMTETYVTDGTDQAEPGHHGSVVTRAAFDGDRLVVTETHSMKGDQGDRTMSRQSIWTLSPDGKVLTIDTTMHTPRGDRNIKSVYVRS
jgi:hypothetical protein